MKEKPQQETTQIETPPEEVTPIATEVSKQRPWFIVGLVLLVVFFLGTTIFFAYQNYQLKQQVLQNQPTPLPEVTEKPEIASPTPTVDSTANWETYSTSTYQVKYPSDMTVGEEEANVLYLSKWGPTQKRDTELYDGISLRFQPFELPDINLESYVQGKIQETETEGIAEILVEPTPINIGGYTGLTYTSRGLGTHKYIYIQSFDKIMLMEIIDSTNDPTNQGFQQTTDKILSTFSFL